MFYSLQKDKANGKSIIINYTFILAIINNYNIL